MSWKGWNDGTNFQYDSSAHRESRLCRNCIQSFQPFHIRLRTMLDRECWLSQVKLKDRQEWHVKEAGSSEVGVGW